MHRHARRWLEKPWFAALLLTVLIFRALLPAGFMLGTTDAGGLGLRLCSLHAAPAPASGGSDASTPHPGDGLQRHDGTGVCPFAAALGATAPPAEAWALPPGATPRSDFTDATATPAALFRPAAHLPRGPPPIA